jgi:hypothetical protein
MNLGGRQKATRRRRQRDALELKQARHSETIANSGTHSFFSPSDTPDFVEGQPGNPPTRGRSRARMPIEIGHEIFALNLDHHARRPCAAPGFHQGVRS